MSGAGDALPEEEHGERVGGKRKAEGAPDGATAMDTHASSWQGSPAPAPESPSPLTFTPFVIAKGKTQATLPFAASPEHKEPKEPPRSAPSSPADTAPENSPAPMLIRGTSANATVRLDSNSQEKNGNGSQRTLWGPAPPPLVPVPPKLKWKGLDNYGNTCYVNVIVQSLFFCPGFAAALRQFIDDQTRMLTEEQARKVMRKLPAGLPLAGQLNQLFISMNPDHPDTINASLSAFLREMRKADKRFQGAGQQDAQEFLNFLLLQLHSTAAELQKPPPAPRPVKQRPLASLTDSGSSTASDSDLVVEPSKRMRAGEEEPQQNGSKPTEPAKTFVSEMFEGKLELAIKCLECENLSAKPEPFMDVSLSLLGNRQARTLEALLQDFFHTERLSGRDKFFCDVCHAKTEAKRGYVIASLPPVLTLHLKRFSYETTRKICTHFLPDLEMSFSAYCRDPGPAVVYHLYAVVFHSGYFSNSGHYRCVVREGEHWLLFDDEDLSNAEFLRMFPVETESTSTAYILFYSRIASPEHHSPSATLSTAAILSSMSPPLALDDADAPTRQVSDAGNATQVSTAPPSVPTTQDAELPDAVAPVSHSTLPAAADPVIVISPPAPTTPAPSQNDMETG